MLTGRAFTSANANLEQCAHGHDAWSGGSFLWIGAIGIRARRAVQADEDKKNDLADQGDQGDQKPPATSASVAKPTYANGNRRYEHCQREQAA